MTPLQCSAPTAAHDGQTPRRYFHRAPSASMVMCSGCYGAARLTMDWQPDRRSEVRPQRPAWSLRLRGAALRLGLR